MQRLLQRVSGPSIGCLLALSFTAGMSAAPAVFVSGLENPSKLIAVGNGSLLVTEAGPSPNSGRVSLIDGGGARHTLIDGLPSGLAAPDFMPDGPNGLALDGDTLYIANGEGDAHVNGPRTGSLELNPNGPSSPIFATVLRVRFSAAPSAIVTGFSTALANQFTLADGLPVMLTNAQGQTAMLDLVSIFRVDRPDPVSIYRNTHLYGLALGSENPGTAYVVDAGNNAIWTAKLGGTPKLLVRFPNTPDPFFPKGPPTSEAVPTSIHDYKGLLLVTLFSGAPFAPGASRVLVVDSKTGNSTQLIGGLSSAIDALYRPITLSNQSILVLEYSANMSITPAAPGRLLNYGPTGTTVLADNLVTPSSMALDEPTKTLFIADRSEGTILKLALQ